MDSAWATQYLAIPFLEKGRTRAGVDCYGLARLIYAEQRGILLPSYDESYETVQDTHEIVSLLEGAVGSAWKEVPLVEASEYDGLLLRILGHPTHFGIVLRPPWFIHAIKDTSAKTGKVRIERWDSLLWQRRVMGALRCQLT